MKFVRLTQSAMAGLIPRELFEQIKDDTLIVDNMVKHLPAILKNPMVYFWVVIDSEKNQIVGFFWTEINVFSNRLLSLYMSLLPGYQGNGVLHRLFELNKIVIEQQGLESVFELHSLHPSIAKRYGGTESSCRIFEFDIRAENYGEARKADGNVAETENTS